MTWHEIIQSAIMALHRHLETAGKLHRSNIEAMNSSPSRMESRYDASREEYSFQVANSHETIETYRCLLSYLESLLQNDAITSRRIGPGSVAQIQYHTDLSTDWFLIVPESGGLDFKYEEKTVHIISSGSPIGKTLLAHRANDTITIRQTGAQITILTHLSRSGSSEEAI